MLWASQLQCRRISAPCDSRTSDSRATGQVRTAEIKCCASHLQVETAFWEHIECTRHIEAGRGADRGQLQQQISVLQAQNSVQDDIDQAADKDAVRGS